MTQATQFDDNVDGLSRLQLWKLQTIEVPYLTQVVITNHNREVYRKVIKVTRTDDAATHEEVARANARAEETNAQTSELAKKFEYFHK